jgi:hypothetical protein
MEMFINKAGCGLVLKTSVRDVTQLQSDDEQLTINKHNQLYEIVSRYRVINKEKAVN